MKDTQSFIYRKQYEIISAKPIEERARLGVETIDGVRKMVEMNIQYHNPTLSKVELKIAVFKHFYSDIFTKNQME